MEQRWILVEERPPEENLQALINKLAAYEDAEEQGLRMILIAFALKCISTQIAMKLLHLKNLMILGF